MIRRSLSRPRDLRHLVIGASDRPGTRVITTVGLCQASPSCPNPASGWIHQDGRSIRACGPCRGKAGIQ